MSDYYLRVDKPKVFESKRNLSLSNQVFLLGTERNLSTPPILYKYFKLGNDGENDFTNRILDTITEGVLWFSTKRYLNDPCEMSYVNVAANSFPTPDHRVSFSIEPLSKKVAENFNKCRISCFSEYWNIGPMWANYSGGQNGICIGFETKNLIDCFFPVIYKSKVNKDFLSGEQGLLNAFSLKDESWSYEAEWRLIYPWNPLRIKENYNNDGLLQSLNLSIKEIVFGNQVNSDIKNLIMNNHLTKENCEIFETTINSKIERKPLTK